MFICDLIDPTHFVGTLCYLVFTHSVSKINIHSAIKVTVNKLRPQTFSYFYYIYGFYDVFLHKIMQTIVHICFSPFL